MSISIHLKNCFSMVIYCRNLLLLFISEPNKRDLTQTKNEHGPTSVAQKPKLSKAERRAIQESQRAAKAAAKEAGS